MRNTIAFCLICLVLILFILAGCSPLSSKVSVTSDREVNKKSEQEATQGWELDWGRILSEAKKEGKIVLASTAQPPVREAISNALEKKYGVKLEWMVGRASDLPPEILQERRAGIYTVDIYQGGAQPVLQMLKPKKVFDPILPILILPEVKDETAYWQGRYPLAERDGLVWSMSKYAQEPFEINTDFVKKEEIVSYKDLLQPKCPIRQLKAATYPVG